jgi:DNA-binding NarL/FixJ family response regulator
MIPDSVLVVEDLDEPRAWLVEVLPRALPGVRRVDGAASLAEARALMRQRHYGLALIDWGLPDGSGRELIEALARQTPPTLVVVATIHDDDAHVFPALQAGASGYVLKSQPRAVVEAQLRRIAQGEPPLSPSIAVRVLSHFRTPGAAALPAGLPGAAADPSGGHLTEREADVLRLIAKGYKAAECARLLKISVNTVNGYVREIYRKLGIGSRAEAALEATRRGLVG